LTEHSTRIAVVAGLGLGDEGKGSFVDAWVRRNARPTLVVRYNGGPQAAHHVVLADGRSHCFAQLGSGMLVPNTATLLSSFMLIEPLALLREVGHLAALGVSQPLARTIVSRRSVLVTPFHKLVGRLRELSRGSARHGSCGLGVGQAWLDSQNPSLPSLRIEDLLDPVQLRQKLRFLQLVKLDQAEQIVDGLRLPPEQTESRLILDELGQHDWPTRLAIGYARFLESGITLDDGSQLQRALDDPQQPVIFEGAQGTLLDAVHGFFPFVTPSRTSFANALSLLNGRPAQRLGVLRAYATRHGPGPLVSEEHSLTVRLDEQHNVTNPWQGPMRVGWFDAVAARYALRIAGGIDRLALTCLDRLQGLGPLQLCHAYRYVDEAPTDLVEYFVVASDGSLIDMKLAEQPSLHRQARLSELLTRCQPVLRPLPAIESVRGDDGTPTTQAEDYLTNLLCELRLQPEQLGCISMGTTATDKVWR